jgi:lysophospholipase L1-like esterase
MTNRRHRIFPPTALLVAGGLAYAACGLAASAREPHRFESEIAAFEKWDRQNATPKAPILFVGSSSIRLWKTAEAFPEAPVINRGFGGSTIADANHYFDRVVVKYKPRAIFLYAGDNDIAAGMSPQRVYDDFLEFARRVREQLDNTPIYFISIKPSIARLKLWPQMKEANGFIQKFAEAHDDVTFIDIDTPMLAGREAPPIDLFLNDGLHLNAKGYDVWNKTLSPAVAELRKRE